MQMRPWEHSPRPHHRNLYLLPKCFSFSNRGMSSRRCNTIGTIKGIRQAHCIMSIDLNFPVWAHSPDARKPRIAYCGAI